MLAAYLTILMAVWATAVAWNRWSVRRHDGAGDPRQGVVIFVEPVRWLFVIWGFRSFCEGLRRGGYRGQIRLFRWSTTAGALLVVPDAVRRSRLIRRATRLAERIERMAAPDPACPIHLCGYSSGCYIVLEALRRLERARIRNTILLAGTISPRYPLESLDARTDRLLHVYSPIDIINLLGPMLIGTNDRHWMPACGSVGFAARPPAVRQRRWRLGDLRSWYLGDHFTVVSPRFVSMLLAPLVREAPPARSSLPWSAEMAT